MDDLGPEASLVYTLVYKIIMTGRNTKTARPTILVCSTSKVVRQQALKLLKQSSISDAYPDIRVAESSKGPELV
jgi:hypothetical protein